MAEQLGEAVLTIKADTQQLDAGLQRARQGLKNVEQDSQAAAGGFEKLGGVIRNLAAQLAVLETARRVAFFTGQQIQDLDSASAAVRTLGVNSDELTTRLRALSVELGGSVSVIQLTKAAYDVASSGFASAGDATQVLRASALGAKGGFAELDDVVRAVTGVLNAYGSSADEATNIVDTFLQTQNDGVITVRQYAAEIGNVASIAAASGVSLQELNAAIATATLRGVPVAQTFTGIRQALSSIIKPSEQAKDLARALGLDYSVAALQSKGFAGVLADVQAKTGGATDKLAVLLGSVEAQAAIQPLLNDKLVKYNELLSKQAQSAGAAGAAAKINAETISDGLAQIGNGFSNLATTLDKSLKPVFAGLIASLNDILTKLQQVSALSPEKVQAREQQATRIIDTVKQNSPNYNTRAFYGTPLVSPNTEIVFDGKTFKGTITGVRNDLVKYLLQKDLAAINKPEAPRPINLGQRPPQPQINTPSQLSPGLAAGLQQANAKTDQELQTIRDRIEAAREMNNLDEVGKAKVEARLAISEKLRDNEALRVQLAAELNKPQGVGDGSDGKRNEGTVNNIRNQLKRAEAELALIRVEQENKVGEVQKEALSKAKSKADQMRSQMEQGAKAIENAASKAASNLKDAFKSYQDTLRGGFQYLTPELQQQQLERARAAIQPLVNNGVIRQGIDISSPDKLFQVASFAESYQSASQKLGEALSVTADSVKKLAQKNWTVNVNVPSGSATGDVVGAINGGLR